MAGTRETTEFEDALAKHGIVQGARELEVTQEDLEDLVDTVVATYNKFEGKDRQEVEDEGDDDDERAFEEYRRQRFQEMQQAAARARYGDLKTISHYEYADEVSKAPEDVHVVVHLYKDGVPACDVLNERLGTLARKHRATKFVRIISTDCIRNYPDTSLPTILVYKGGNVLKQLVGVRELGGAAVTANELEWILSGTGAVETELEHDPRLDRKHEGKGRQFAFSRYAGSTSDSD